MCNLAAKLVACRLWDIVELTRLNSGIIPSSFVFVYKHKLTTKDGRCRGLTKAKGPGLCTWQVVEQRRVTWRSAMDNCSLVNSLHCGQSTWAESPSRWMQEFILAVAKVSITCETVPLSGDKNEGFQSKFFHRHLPQGVFARVLRPCIQGYAIRGEYFVFAKDRKPGAGSTHTVTPPSHRSSSREKRTMISLLRSSSFLLATNEKPMSGRAMEVECG